MTKNKKKKATECEWMSYVKVDSITNTKLEKFRFDPAHGRTPHMRDSGSIIHSSQFRRMSYKTQVYSLPEIDYPRTRLPHTIEVAQIGRQITRAIYEKINLTDVQVRMNFEDLVYAACLAHDIGHPPFGHMGAKLLEKLTGEATNNQYTFDDNKQVVRLLMGSTVRDSFGVTAGLVDSVIKKKWDSSKHCYESERDRVVKIIDTITKTGLKRNPACYVMEVADDIAYLCSDIEDAIWLKILDQKDLKEWLSHIPYVDDLYCTTDKSIFEIIVSNDSFFEQPSKIAGKLIKPLIKHAIEGLCKKITKKTKIDELPEVWNDFILSHQAKSEPYNFLYWTGPSNIGIKGESLAAMKDGVYKQKILKSEAVAQQSIMAEKVVGDLWEALLPLANRDGYKKEFIFNLIPPYVQKKIENFHKESLKSKETGAQMVADYISGMTDRYAIKFWEKLYNPK
ncbi:MAG: dNTP triphosphohydrolase, partial [Bdellovibrionales bacterium]|nr:dNTP triphosphohydrolase [Bdellovibrionales bacterium]